jgi:hypothetical protein
MRRFWALGVVLAALVLVLAGCPLDVGGVTITGTVSASYFNITSDVTVTIAQGGSSFSIAVPLAGNSNQIGSFLIANIPAGTYAAELTFEADNYWIAGTVYRINGGAWIPVDNEVVSGSSVPYTFTITIDSLPVSADDSIDIDFGDAG